MKRTLLFIIATLIAGSAYCQIPEVMVGDTDQITIFHQPDGGQYSACQDQEFSLRRHLNNNFFYFDINSSRSQLGQGDTLGTLFRPLSIGEQSDSAIFWSFWECGPPSHLFYFADTVRYFFQAKGIDSIVVIKAKDLTIVVPIDTQVGKYKSQTEPFYFYSNIADSVLFNSWQLIIDVGSRMSYKVDSNTNSLSEYLSKPFTRKKQLNFTFSTSLAASDTAHSFPATMKTRVRYKGVDSVYSNNFTIVLPAAPKSDVRDENIQGITFAIYPNPISKQATFTVTTPRSEPVTLEIYDLLGNHKMNVTANNFISGSQAFHIDVSSLPAGSYFARLASGTQVITRRIVVEK